jgi:hypothetical protein
MAKKRAVIDLSLSTSKFFISDFPKSLNAHNQFDIAEQAFGDRDDRCVQFDLGYYSRSLLARELETWNDPDPYDVVVEQAVDRIRRAASHLPAYTRLLANLARIFQLLKKIQTMDEQLHLDDLKGGVGKGARSRAKARGRVLWEKLILQTDQYMTAAYQNRDWYEAGVCLGDIELQSAGLIAPKLSVDLYSVGSVARELPERHTSRWPAVRHLTEATKKARNKVVSPMAILNRIRGKSPSAHYPVSPDILRTLAIALQQQLESCLREYVVREAAAAIQRHLEYLDGSAITRRHSTANDVPVIVTREMLEYLKMEYHIEPGYLGLALLSETQEVFRIGHCRVALGTKPQRWELLRYLYEKQGRPCRVEEIAKNLIQRLRDTGNDPKPTDINLVHQHIENLNDDLTQIGVWTKSLKRLGYQLVSLESEIETLLDKYT